MYTLTLLLSFFAGSTFVAPLACDCDHIISTEQNYIHADKLKKPVRPGDKICIEAGVRGRLRLSGFKGTKEQPLTFINCGGQVIFENDGIDGTFIFANSRYFRVTGTGSKDHQYGFLIRTASKGSAMYVTESDFELDHIEVANAGFAGIMAKIDAKCDNTEYHRGNFVMENVSIHDNYIHDTHGEALYIGDSWYKGKKIACGVVYPHEIHGLRIFNNKIENTGADGIQVGCATRDVQVYNNSVRNYGTDPFAPVQNNGIILNGGTTGKWFNNTIIDGSGMGISCFGIGNVYLYNNLIVRAGTDGIFIDERGAMLPGAGTHTHNNTIISPKRDGIRIYSRTSVGNTFINNLVVAPGSLGTEYYNKNHFLYVINDKVDYSMRNNLFVTTVDEVLFVKPEEDNYKLQAGSPALDKGTNIEYLRLDFNQQQRPRGTAFDIGAFEGQE